MNAPRISIRQTRTLAAMMLMVGTAMSLAAEPPAAMPTPSKEMREKMAAIHEKMAACLRSERTFAECREEMQQNCSDMMGEQGCPMMGMGMRGRMMGPQQDQ
jgi:hypothetical protein